MTIFSLTKRALAAYLLVKKKTKSAVTRNTKKTHCLLAICENNWRQPKIEAGWYENLIDQDEKNGNRKPSCCRRQENKKLEVHDENRAEKTRKTVCDKTKYKKKKEARNTEYKNLTVNPSVMPHVRLVIVFKRLQDWRHPTRPSFCRRPFFWFVIGVLVSEDIEIFRAVRR